MPELVRADRDKVEDKFNENLHSYIEKHCNIDFGLVYINKIKKLIIKLKINTIAFQV